MDARHIPREATFWSLLEPRAREALLRIGRWKPYEPREALLRKGDASDHLLVVGRGCVKVVASTSRGYEAVLAIRGTGDLLGEQAAFDGSPRSASVLALTSTRALLLPLSDFDALCRTEAAVARALRHTQSDRLRQADRRRVAAGAREPANGSPLCCSTSASVTEAAVSTVVCWWACRCPRTIWRAWFSRRDGR